MNANMDVAIDVRIAMKQARHCPRSRWPGDPRLAHQSSNNDESSVIILTTSQYSHQNNKVLPRTQASPNDCPSG